MTAFIIRRLTQSILVVFVMSFLVFTGVNIVGDPVEMMVSEEADQAERERVIRSMGLDQPWYVQYGRFVVNAVQGDLGKSFVYGEQSLGIILQRMPATFELALAALILAVIFGIPLGVYAGLKPDAGIAFGFDEIGQHIFIPPTGIAHVPPVVVILPLAANIDHRVDRA